jgi:RES domain-containing protein
MDLEPEVIHIHDTGYRYSSYDTPLWSRPNSQGGRWHSRGDGPTQYLALSTDGAWAELIRSEELTSEQEVSRVHIQMWEIQIDQALIIDYSSFEKAQDAGFDPKALISDDYARCRQEGARLRAAGYHGVLAPNAALPGERNLTLFGPRIASSWNRPKLLESSMPARVIAVGSPPTGLHDRVRRYGDPHSGLEAFLREHASRRLDSS